MKHWNNCFQTCLGFWYYFPESLYVFFSSPPEYFDEVIWQTFIMQAVPSKYFHSDPNNSQLLKILEKKKLKLF